MPVIASSRVDVIELAAFARVHKRPLERFVPRAARRSASLGKSNEPRRSTAVRAEGAA